MIKTTQYKPYSPLLTVVMLSAMISLSACSSPKALDKPTQAQKIDDVLQKAAYNAAVQGKNDDSISLLESIYKRNSSDPKAAIQYSQALRSSGRNSRAALVMAPFAQEQDPEAQAEYAAIKTALGEYDQAEAMARSALSLDPDAAIAHQILGITLDTQGKYEDAEQSFRSALVGWKGNPGPVLNNLGLNLAAQGKLKEALDVLTEAANISPGRQEIERNLRIVSALYDEERKMFPEESPTPLFKPE